MPKKLLWVLGRGRCLAIRVNHSAKANPNANARVKGDALLNADAGKNRKDDQSGGRSVPDQSVLSVPGNAGVRS